MLNQNEEIAVHRKADKRPVIGAFLMVIAIGFYVFFSRGLAGGVAEANARVGEVRDRIEEISDEIAGLLVAQEELGIDSEVKRLESRNAIPEGLFQDEIIRDLIVVAGDHDVNLHSVSFGKSGSARDGIGSVQINASFDGNYSDLTKFLKGMEENGRLFRVNSISVQLSRLGVNQSQRATFSLAMEAFYQL
ncbi:hypothetical protein JKY72_02890 [Candidatus Gracilibacteria bacterium]|nr:hypothetical protein [Candidatus Gracilibacteria bacterium]